MKLKNATIAVGAVTAVALSFMFTVTSREALPDRARFIVNTKEQYIVPKPIPGQYIARPLPGDSVGLQGPTVTWEELMKSDNPYHDFGLPQTPEWGDYHFYGQEITLFRSLFFPPPSRWDEEGCWRY